MSGILSSLEPKPVWEIFEEITRHPRPSKKEEKILAYIKDFAAKLGLPVKEDSVGNLAIRKPATPGMEGRAGVAIQAHVDMVCEKNRDVQFDFDNDPIQPWIDGDWVKARGTTLGADNGIGLAMGMAVLASKDMKHPEFELLCTVDEETGLTGAIKLGTDLLETSEVLINLDSEEDGHFTIGCAGGLNTNAVYKMETESVPEGYAAYEIGIKGLRGGHSGIEINDGRANSVVLLTRMLWDISHKFKAKLASFDSGNKHNAIPREGFAIILIRKEDEGALRAFIEETETAFRAEWLTKEPSISLVFQAADMPASVMADAFARTLLNSFYAMPHGVLRMSPDIPGLVQTSMNFAIVETSGDEIKVLTSQRSLMESEKYSLSDKVRSIYELAGAEVLVSDGYPAWQPDINSPILATAKNIFKDMYGKEPVIEVIHAGLECGLVGEKYPGMDMLSFGPTLKEVHTPDEKVQVSTVDKCWKLLTGIIENMPEKA